VAATKTGDHARCTVVRGGGSDLAMSETSETKRRSKLGKTRVRQDGGDENCARNHVRSRMGAGQAQGVRELTGKATVRPKRPPNWADQQGVPFAELKRRRRPIHERKLVRGDRPASWRREADGEPGLR